MQLPWYVTALSAAIVWGIHYPLIDFAMKRLSVYSRVPESVLSRIEKLFQEAQKDISKVGELKLELDRWKLYKDYEDRFLDLFKGNKG